MTISVEIALSAPLRRFASGPDAVELERRSEIQVGDLVANVGLTGAVSVHVSASDARRPLRVLVNGSSVPFPPDLLWQLWIERPDDGAGAGNGSGRSVASDCLAAHCRTADCCPADVAELVADMIRDRPSLLVDHEQAAAYAAAAGSVDVSDSALQRTLASLLDLGVAPLPREAVLDALGSSGGSVEDAVEAAFAALQARRIEIAVSNAYRGVLTGQGSAGPELVSESGVEPSAKEMFRLAEERLLVEWGIVPPDVVWTTDDVPDGSIAVKVNDRRSSPFRGLQRGERLVLADSSRELASAGIEPKRKVVNPANPALELAVVDAAAADHLESSVGTAPPAGFVALVLYRELVANADRLLGTEQTLYLLQDLERRTRIERRARETTESWRADSSGWDSELVHFVLRHFTVAEITHLLRALVRERIPPRLLPVVLEQLVRLVDRPLPAASRVEFVRRGLSAYLSHRFARGDMARTFFELAPELEQEVGTGASDDLHAEQVRDAVWAALREANVAPARAAVLVHKAPRDVVRDLLAPELPEVVVIGRSELRADTPETAATIDLRPDGTTRGAEGRPPLHVRVRSP